MSTKLAMQQVQSKVSEIARKMAGGGSDARFFSTTKKGETHELREQLNHQSRDRKKDAVKKVIANMTVGKDVSMLFTDVVNCMQTADTQLKKLVYLYLINYAKSHPDLAILAVNTFVKDANDPNPLIRALSVRTMGCIRVDRITEYLCEPLRRALQDDDPYVRKAAAICVAKLYDINPGMVEEQGFLDSLRDLLSDSNPTVVANAVAALCEISENGQSSLFKESVTKPILQKLLAALNECSEWGQIFVLDALAQYSPSDSREAESIIERVVPRLQHANSAVVLSAIKVIMKCLERVSNADTARTLSRKMAPPLVTLLSTEPEIQYVALRNINLIVQKRPDILSHEIKVFFCKYNDPIYVKMEKLDIIIRLVSSGNIKQVLLELKEYATEVDVDFVRRAVRAIGRCAVKLEDDTESCIKVLLELIQTKVNYIVQEAIVVIKDIFRKYPNKYESIIATLCEDLDTLDEPEAKASMIWIIGEYAERIDNADEILESFLDAFHDETAQVQLQLLTSTVKLFLKRPSNTQEIVQKVLTMATENCDNPDVRDRGYVYWRLLSSNPEAAKAVVLAEKPGITDGNFQLDPTLLDQLIERIATLSSVYHKLPDAFVVRSNVAELREETNEEENNEDQLCIDENEGGEEGKVTGVDLLNMEDLSINSTPPPSVPISSSNPLDDIFGGTTNAKSSSLPVLVSAEKKKGMILRGQFSGGEKGFCLDMEFENQSSVPLSSFAIQFNKSYFGVVSTQQQFTLPSSLSLNSTTYFSLPMTINPNFVNPSASSSMIQVALKNLQTNDVVYFECILDISVLCSKNGTIEKTAFIHQWQAIPASKEQSSIIRGLYSTDIDSIASRLQLANIFLVARRSIQSNQQMAYFSFMTLTNSTVLVELTFQDGVDSCKMCIRTENFELITLFEKIMEKQLTNC